MTTATRADRLREIRLLHDQWAMGQEEAAAAVFDPAGRKKGSDYNQHNITVDAPGSAQDEFVAAATQLLAGGSGQTAATRHNDDVWTPAEELSVHRGGDGRFGGIDIPGVPAGGERKPSSATTVEAGDFSGLTLIEGQKGFNEGGLYRADDGSRWYIKAQRSDDNARNEALANALYRELYFDVPDVYVGRGADVSTGPQTASRWVDTDNPELPLSAQSPSLLKDARNGFAVDAWLANWDVAGAGGRHNIESKGGFAFRVESGGALKYRGTGRPKGDTFGDTADEWDTMRDPKINPSAAALFAPMTLEQLAESGELLEGIDPKKIRAIVAEYEMEPALADKLIARRADILARAEAARLEIDRRDKIAAPGGALTGRSALEAAPLRLPAAETGFGVLDVDAELVSRTGDMPWSPTKLAAVSRVLRLYRTGTYRQIGARMRDRSADDRIDIRETSGGPVTRESIDVHVATMFDAFDASRTTAPVQVWRGIQNLTDVFPDLDTSGDMTGAEWTEVSPMSTSADPSVSRIFSSTGGAIMRIHMPAGTGAIQLSGWRTEKRHNEEAELLVQPYVRMRVLKDTPGVGKYDPRILDVELEVIPDE